MKHAFYHNLQNLKASFIEGFKRDTGYGVDVVLDHDFVRNNGFLFAVCVRYVDDSYKIIVDDEFDKMTDTVKNFIVWHELGHIGDTNTTRSLKQEFKADRHAASKVGIQNAVSALNYLWITSAQIDIGACADIPSRLKELGANVDNMYILQQDGTKLKEQDLRILLN